MSTSRALDPGEVPSFTLCESVHASSTSPWHIRHTKDRIFLGGGLDTPSLCRLVTPEVGGWDLNIRITERHLEGSHICPKCLAAYRKAS